MKKGNNLIGLLAVTFLMGAVIKNDTSSQNVKPQEKVVVKPLPPAQSIVKTVINPVADTLSKRLDKIEETQKTTTTVLKATSQDLDITYKVSNIVKEKIKADSSVNTSVIAEVKENLEKTITDSLDKKLPTKTSSSSNLPSVEVPKDKTFFQKLFWFLPVKKK